MRAPAIPGRWFEPVRLPGGKALPGMVLPGPMHGLTTGSFCDIMAERGYVRSWIAPFIRLSTDVPRLGALRRKLSPFLDSGLPVIAQVMGSDIGLLCRAAGCLQRLNIAAIDLNCGCPSKSVVRNGAGGDCLRRTDWLRAACVALRQACPDCGFSIKLRAGYADPDELPDILAAVKAGCPDMVVMHYRTVLEEYRPISDGAARLAQARDLLPDTALIGSGDLYTVEDAARMYAVAGVDGVAPARGLLHNPRLLRDLESAAAGIPVQPFTESDQDHFLLDLALAARAKQVRHTGFLAEIAKHMRGVDSDLFAELGRRAGDLDRCIAMLHERVLHST